MNAVVAIIKPIKPYYFDFVPPFEGMTIASSDNRLVRISILGSYKGTPLPFVLEKIHLELKCVSSKDKEELLDKLVPALSRCKVSIKLDHSSVPTLFELNLFRVKIAGTGIEISIPVPEIILDKAGFIDSFNGKAVKKLKINGEAVLDGAYPNLFSPMVQLRSLNVKRISPNFVIPTTVTNFYTKYIENSMIQTYYDQGIRHISVESVFPALSKVENCPGLVIIVKNKIKVGKQHLTLLKMLK